MVHGRAKGSVLVTGAGFTRAFLPDSPLLVDDFGAPKLAAKVMGMPNASRVLDWERNQHGKGYINIERLMTRLDSLMPYDEDQGATDEYRFLHSALMDSFLDRIRRARTAREPNTALQQVARYCVSHRVDCITFNYDDVLDQALAEVEPSGDSLWHANGGYGFYCRDSIGTIGDHYDANIGRKTAMLVLKLHGSMNWRPRRGYSEPYELEAITHYETWPDNGRWETRDPELVERHLERRPLIAPPVLSKSSLVGQPVLRLVWSLAFEILARAHSVTFVGYSFPMTDMASRTLFSEALKDIPGSAIRVVDLARGRESRNRIMKRYRSILGDIPDRQFQFNGALKWSKEFRS